MAKELVEGNKNNFQKEVIEASEKIPVIVDFYADWCMPCRILGPVLEKVASSYKGKLKLVKINTEENPELAEKYDIMSIPSVKLFRNREVVDEFVGSLPESEIKEFIEKNL